MYKVISNDGDVAYGIKELVCDTVEDLKTLPSCQMGSSVLVIEDATVYMKNGEGEWVKL